MEVNEDSNENIQIDDENPSDSSHYSDHMSMNQDESSEYNEDDDAKMGEISDAQLERDERSRYADGISPLRIDFDT